MEQRFRVTIGQEAEMMANALGAFGKFSSELAQHGEAVSLA